MGISGNVPRGEGGEYMGGETRYTDVLKLVKNDALIEAEPTEHTLLENSFTKPGGSIYYGTGLTTPNAISVGLPFDVLGMMLTAERLRRAGQFETVIHHIADTHAKTNDWINEAAVDSLAAETKKTLESVKSGLGLDNFEIILSSTFDTTSEYKAILEAYEDSEEAEYVKRELADITWYKAHKDLRLKTSWIIQAKETELGFDERRFDREFLRYHPDGLSFVYTKPGRTHDPSRPKASPYISIEGEERLLIRPNQNVEAILQAAYAKDPNLGGAKKHLTTIVRIYEQLFGSLGKIGRDGVTLEGKLQHIIDQCFGG